MASRKKSRGRILLSFLLLIPLAFAGTACWSGNEIASPARRPLMDYHREFLAGPAAHGIQIIPFTASDGTPSLIVTPDASSKLGARGTILRQQLAARGLALQAPGQIIGTLVLVHGRKGRKEDYLPIAERLCAAGFRCLIPDLPAHGDHPDDIARYGVGEAALPHLLLGEAAIAHQFDPAPAGLIGMSMGGSVAIHAAAQPGAPWQALAVISSFDSFHTVVNHQAARHLGTPLGTGFGRAAGIVYRWRSGIPIEAIQPHLQAPSIHIPTLVSHGTADQIIPLSSGRTLFESFPNNGENRWVEVPTADHDNVLITDFPIYAEITEWMLRHMR